MRRSCVSFPACGACVSAASTAVSRRKPVGWRRRDLVRQHPRRRPRLRDRSVSRNAGRGSREIHWRRSFLLCRGTVGRHAARRSEPAMTWNLASGLDGKRVLVTGGAGGIGREVALAFGAAGSLVAVVDLDEDKVRAVVAEMEGGPHLPLAADLRPVAGHAKLVENVVARAGRPRRSRLRGSRPGAPRERG